jgi:hypothetical protein
MRRFVRLNGLSLAFLALFLGALCLQALAGYHEFNDEQAQHSEPGVSFGRYITSSQFGSAVMENWQSEYLQFTLFVLLTVWLVQRGSPESKEPGKEGRGSDEDQLVGDHVRTESPRWTTLGGLRRMLYENSLLIVMGAIWVCTWVVQSVTGLTEFNADQQTHGQERASWLEYVGSADFWEKTLQNWQSEFLAVGSMVVLSIYLRQRGSPESKPVGAAHHATGVEG